MNRPSTCAPPDFSFPVRVYWEDTDAGGIVFYANYLKFFERARTEWLRALGYEQHSLRQTSGGMFVVHSTAVRYKRSARLDDLLSVTVKLAESGRSGLLLTQQAWRGSELLAEGEIRIAWVDAASLQIKRIPAELLSAMQAAAAPSRTD